jgi:hypothetical protein
MSQPHFEGVVRSPFTLPKMGLGNHSGLLKTHSAIAGIKTPCIGAFLVSLERSWSVDVQNGLAWAIWTFLAQVMLERKAGSQTGRVKCRWIATHCWKALNKSYNFGSDFVPIQVQGEELWASKVPGVQTGTVSGLHFGSPGKKSHLDVSPVESCKEYYMGEGDGFSRVHAMVSQVSPS